MARGRKKAGHVYVGRDDTITIMWIFESFVKMLRLLFIGDKISWKDCVEKCNMFIKSPWRCFRLLSEDILRKNNSYFSVYRKVILALDAVLCVVVVMKTSFTDIDWTAYMQEVGGYRDGITDYYLLKGETGPLVYPAGFVYLYSFLYKWTSGGVDVWAAQKLFVIMYLLMAWIVYDLYERFQLPPVVMLITSFASYRIHSIFLLRLFNDAPAMLLLYIAIWFFARHRWSYGCIAFSVAVSIKMNVLLFAPGLLVLLIKTQGIRGTINHLAICAQVQLLLGYPFLITNPVAYIDRSFNFGRDFLQEWSVNWAMFPSVVFNSRIFFHCPLLIVHIALIVVLLRRFWLADTPDPLSILTRCHYKHAPYVYTSRHVIAVLCTSNFIGVAVARSLHYQFYIWHYHSIPILLTVLDPDAFCRPSSYATLLLYEIAWNIFPSRWWSSLLIFVIHIYLLRACVFANGKLLNLTARVQLYVGGVFMEEGRFFNKPGAVLANRNHVDTAFRDLSYTSETVHFFNQIAQNEIDCVAEYIKKQI